MLDGDAILLDREVVTRHLVRCLGCRDFMGLTRPARPRLPGRALGAAAALLILVTTLLGWGSARSDMPAVPAWVDPPVVVITVPRSMAAIWVGETAAPVSVLLSKD